MEKPNPIFSEDNYQRMIETPAGTRGTFSFLRIRSESVSMSGIPDFDSDSDFGSDSSSGSGSGLSDPTDAAPLSLPERIGYYQLGERLGEGGMGAVYRATHVLLKREAAIKYIRRSRISPEALDRFARETEVAGKLSDPHLVASYDAGEVNGIPFLVMERLEGQTLAEYIAKNGPVSPKEAIDIVVQAAQGLSCAHKAGLIHRDVKPDNIWITPTGTVKILDLGLSETRESGIAETDELKRLAGTPDFMAPEQANPLGAVDERADIYSLGCVLFFLLAGRAPFDDPNHKTTRQKLAAQTLEPFPKLDKTLVKSWRVTDRSILSRLQTVLEKITAKEPARRYSSMTETIDSLTQASRPWSGLLTILFYVAFFLLGIIVINFIDKNFIDHSNDFRNSSQLSSAPNSNGSDSFGPGTGTTWDNTDDYEAPNADIDSIEYASLYSETFPAGNKAGEVYSCKAGGIEYSFRWCPPGTFTMGSHDSIPVVSEKTPYFEMLGVARQYGLLDENEIEAEMDELEFVKSRYKNDADRLEFELEYIREYLKDRLCAIIQNDYFRTNPTEEFKHQVTLTHGFWLLESEVTQQMWRNITGKTGYFSSDGAGRSRCVGQKTDLWPISAIKWVEIQDFCMKLSEKIEVPVSLPTEAQWEYACRAGAKGEITDTEKLKEIGWFWSPDFENGGHPFEIKTKLPNAWGLYDMLGNVFELCSDWYKCNLGVEPVVDPWGPDLSKNKVFIYGYEKYGEESDSPVFPGRVIRGQSFQHDPERPVWGKSASYSYRAYMNYKESDPIVGFRICVNVPQRKIRAQ